MALGNQLRELVDAFSELVAHHVRLARMELKEDARFIGVRVGLIAALAPLILVGYCFLCIALALTLRRWMGEELAFMTVGLLNLLIGGVGLAVVGKQLSGHKVMDATVVELASSTALVLPHPEKRPPAPLGMNGGRP
ncbi:MAG: phage holin family protein [Archangium sp.]|nr:phage holin family protein [Archangium sp.]